MQSLTLLLFATGTLTFTLAQTEQQHPYSAQEEGFGRVHMEISCSTTVGADFDRALALLHNFRYARALARFNELAKNDPACAMAYWGAAMTYNHLSWDPPSKADETAAWALCNKGCPRRKRRLARLYLAAVAALYKDAGAGSKSSRDQNYRDATAAAYAQYPDDETALFYRLSILGAMPEGSHGLNIKSKQQNSLRPCMPSILTIRAHCII